MTETRAPLFISESNNEEDSASKVITCELCPNKCVIKNGLFGLCRVRGNKNGKGIIPYHGFITALAVDPIEKKPLYHFKPGSQILSLGFSGCNLRCPFCQNWHISQNTDTPGKNMKVGEIISAALKQNIPSIAYTYSEPLVHIEYLLDCMTIAHKHGIANVLVTNGCINEKPAEEILKLTDAANVDLKCFSAKTYQKILGYGSDNTMQAVLDFIKLGYKMGVHLEITTLVVPELNDSEDELLSAAKFIATLNETEKSAAKDISNDTSGKKIGIPLHFSAYHPDHKWNAPPTDAAFLFQIAEKSRKLLPYIYTGNITGDNNTKCHSCGAFLVRRFGYNVDTGGLVEKTGKYYCRKCGGLSVIRCYVPYF